MNIVGGSPAFNAKNHEFNNQKLTYKHKTRNLNNLDKEETFPLFLRDLAIF